MAWLSSRKKAGDSGIGKPDRGRRFDPRTRRGAFAVDLGFAAEAAQLSKPSYPTCFGLEELLRFSCNSAHF